MILNITRMQHTLELKMESPFLILTFDSFIHSTLNHNGLRMDRFLLVTHVPNNKNIIDARALNFIDRHRPHTRQPQKKNIYKAIRWHAARCERTSIKSNFHSMRTTPCVRPNKFRKTNSVLSDESVARTRKILHKSK